MVVCVSHESVNFCTKAMMANTNQFVPHRDRDSIFAPTPHPPTPLHASSVKSNWAFMIMTELGNDRLCCSCFRVIGWF